MRKRNLATLAQIGLVGLALALAVTACGGSSNGSGSGSGSSGGGTRSSAPSGGGTAAGGSASSQIKADWEAFFNAKTPVARREALLQNGQVFAGIIKAQAGTGLASSVTAKVTKVQVLTASQAKVTYTILVSGNPMLNNQTGVAVKEGGVWKVGDSSFCGLLALQNGGSTSSLPTACKSAG
jgi:hypothetical protein